jgi:F420-dependent oxidoreductase-like protein
MTGRRPMLLRVFTEPQQGADYEQLLRVARAAEDLGFDAFFRSDHLLKYGDGDGLPGPTPSWPVLAGLARETSRIKLGTLMTSATFQLPAPLAITVATVDRMSGGRVELGIGAGWYEPEHTAQGVPFPSLGERFERFEEQLAIITGMWSTPVGKSFHFAGRHYRLEGSPALPKPAHRVPIVIGGAGPRRTPRLAARFADEFNFTFRGAAESKTAFDRVRIACDEAGRDEPPLFSVAQEVACGHTAEEVARRAAPFGRDLSVNGLAGSPAELVDKIGGFAEIGVSRIYLRILDLDDLDQLELLAGEVLPQL